MNQFLDYISNHLPHELGAASPEAAGRTAQLVFEAELKGDPAFHDSIFPDCRTRAAACLPFQVPSDRLYKRDRAIDVIEAAMLIHRQTEHGEDHTKRIAELRTDLGQLSEIEDAVLNNPRGFWNP